MRLKTLIAALVSLLLLPACFVEETAGTGGGSSSATAPQLTRFFFQPVLVQLGNTEAFTGTADFEDSDGNVETLVIEFTNPDGTKEELPIALSGVSGLTEGRVEIPDGIDLTPEMAGDYTVTAWFVDADGQVSNSMSDTMEVVLTQTSACGLDSTVCAAHEICYDVEPDTCEYADEHLVTIDACDDLSEAEPVKPACVSSIEDPNSPYADMQCDFVQWWTNPTGLDADCRCGNNVVHIDQCKRPGDLPLEVSYGDGPRMRQITNGFPDNGQGTTLGREIILPMSWGDGIDQNQGILFAVNMDNGDRRHVSGKYTDPQVGVQTIGEGPDFIAPKQVLVGADGMLYVVGGQNDQGEPKLWSVDPANGNRTLLWDSETVDEALRCDNGNLTAGRKDLQLHPGSFAMDPEGHFYLSGTPASLPGPAIVKIDKDTYECTYVSMIAAAADNQTTNDAETVGGGYSQVQFPFRGLAWNNGKLYAISNTQFHEIDPASGDRKLLTNAGAGGFGDGPTADQGLGNYYTVYDKHHDVYWTIGGSNIAVAVDPETGDRKGYPCWHPGLGMQGGLCNTTGRMVPGAMDNGGFVVDPDNDRWAYFLWDIYSVVKYDKQTSNANILSL